MYVMVYEVYTYVYWPPYLHSQLYGTLYGTKKIERDSSFLNGTNLCILS